MTREQTTCGREDLRISIGALALGALDADEAREVRRHLAECPECQEEYTSFVGVKRIMDVGLVGAPLPDLDLAAAPGAKGRSRPRFKQPVFATPLRRRLAVGAASCAAALGLLFGGMAIGNHRADQTPVAETALPAVTQSGVTAQISYQGVGWGTWVTAKMSGAPVNEVCTLYVYTKDMKSGDGIKLSSWKSVGEKQIDIPAATALTPDQIDHFEVRVDDQGYDITVPMTS